MPRGVLEAFEESGSLLFQYCSMASSSTCISTTSTQRQYCSMYCHYYYKREGGLPTFLLGLLESFQNCSKMTPACVEGCWRHFSKGQSAVLHCTANYCTVLVLVVVLVPLLLDKVVFLTCVQDPVGPPGVILELF